MSVINEIPLALKIPYATINYEMIGHFDKEKKPTIKFSIENVVNMEDSMQAVEVYRPLNII